MTQSTGQEFIPHFSVWKFSPVQSSPKAFLTWAYVRYLDEAPVPQDLEQPSQSPQSLHLQSTAQTLSSQSVASDQWPTQVAPPYCWYCFFSRVFVLVPSPQVTEQTPQGDHSSHMQSKGQGFLLQTRVSLSLVSQAAPFPVAMTFTFRVRTDSPPPQENWQTLQSTQVSQRQSTFSSLDTTVVVMVALPESLNSAMAWACPVRSTAAATRWPLENARRASAV
mmetsp:Transcript_63303/g.138663  ORF Transcript_63303/g.138663 Transcript_63303/m.138663 type:complete len:222 (-) Transcript_63303:270-935(-)